MHAILLWMVIALQQMKDTVRQTLVVDISSSHL